MAYDLQMALIHATVQLEQPLGNGLRTVGAGFLIDAPRPDGTPRTDVNNPDEAKRNTPLKGLVNMRDFKYSGAGKWEEGKIYDPKNGSDYSCEMTLTDPNTLEVRGFIGVSLFGRTDVWKRQVKK